MDKHPTLIIMVSFLIVGVIVGLIVFGLLNYYNFDYSNPVSGDIISGDYLSGDSGDDEIIEEIEEPYYGPKVFSGDSRSIAFMIDNDVKASLPHAGLNNAYMVYEIIVEGGASRLMAVFSPPLSL